MTISLPIPVLISIFIIIASIYWASLEEASGGGYMDFRVRPIAVMFIILIILVVLGGIYIW